MPLTRYLTNQIKISSSLLKHKLISHNYKENKCEVCGLKEWRGLSLTMDLHHIDGDNRNNKLDNLQILCPNCHRQTPTHSKRKNTNKVDWSDNSIKSAVEQSHNIRAALIKLGVTTITNTYYYQKIRKFLKDNPNVTFLRRQASGKTKKSAEALLRISRLKLISVAEMRVLLDDMSPVDAAKKLGCSENGVRRFMLVNGIPKKPKGYWIKRKLGQTHEEATRKKPERKKRKPNVTTGEMNQALVHIASGMSIRDSARLIGRSTHSSLLSAFKRNNIDWKAA